jgi:hypothetical protein
MSSPLHLPVLAGRDLTGATRELPRDLLGTGGVLLVGFAVEKQAVLDTWLDALAALELPVLEVPVAGRGQRALARFIEGGMVPFVPPERHHTTVVVYTDVDALVRALDLPGPVPAAVVVDAAGAVIAVVQGAATPAGATLVLSRVGAA